MLPSAWPEHEILPAEERLLVQQAHLRPFGTNYLQDAICPELELLAHPDGPRVLLLPLSTTLPCEAGDCAATIDPQPPPRENPTSKETSKRSRGPSSPLGPVRGLAWSTRRLPQPSNDLAGAKDVEVGREPCFLAVTWGCEVRVWQVSSPSRGNYSAFEVGTDWSEIGSSLAAAPKANGARSPSIPSGDGGGGSAPPSPNPTKVGSSGTPEDVRIQMADAEGAEDHRELATAPGESKEGSKPGGVGFGGTSIHSLTFAPATRTRGMTTQENRGEDEVPNKEASPLAAWHPGGVTVLRPGAKLMTLPAPVMRKRTCGSWSGCGKRLAVSSGGEIRIYSPFIVKPTVLGRGASDKPQVEEPPETSELSAPTAPPAVAVSSQNPTSATAATDSDGKCPPAHEVGDFLTVLCVEAILQGGTWAVGLRCPDAAGRGRLSSLSVSRDSSPVSRRTSPTSLSPGRPADARGTVGSPSSRAAPGSNDHYKRSEADSRTCPALPSRSPAFHPSLIGDMRAMCPGGREAFFGTTDGGLGLGSPGGITTVGDILNNSADSDAGVGLISRKKGPMALGGLLEGLNTSLTDPDLRGAANNVVGKVDRVQGFHHVLPGDSWLRSSIHSPVRARLTTSSETRVEAIDQVAVSEIKTALDEVDVSRVNAASSGRSSRPNPLSLLSMVHDAGTPSPGPVSCSCSPQPAYSPEGSPTPPSSPASSEVLDLRGKLGRDGNPGSMNSSRVHPLFRLSLGADPNSERLFTPQKAQQDHLLGNAAGGGTESNARREPLLLRVATSDSCRRSGDQGGDAQAVEIDAIACLPRALSSPDLVAASEDGRLIAVGSHACGLVACYRMIPQRSDAALTHSARGLTAASTVDEEQARTELASGDMKTSELGNGVKPAVSSPHQNRSKVSRRRAKAVCTLRLPEGHRAKGLSFIDTGSAAGAITPAPQDDPDAKTVPSSILVLAAAPGGDGAFSRVRPSRATAGGPGEGTSTSTVLLRFLLPGLAELKVMPPASLENAVSVPGQVAAAAVDQTSLGARRSTDLAGERFAQQETLRVAEVESLEREGSFRLAGSESPVSQEGLVIRGHPAAWAYPVSPQNGNLSPFLMERGVSDGRSGSPLSALATGSSLHALGRRSSENSGKSLRGGAVGGRFHAGTGNEEEERMSSKRRGAPIRRETSREDFVDKFGGPMGQGGGLMVVEALERMEGRMNARFDGIERMLSGMHERLCSVELALTNTRLA